MSAEETIKADLAAKFPYLAEKIRVQRARRIFVRVEPDNFSDVFYYLVNDAGFPILCTITGLDDGDTLGAIYHIATESGIVLSLQTNVPKDKPVLQTITARFPAAEVSERELIDLLGMQVQGLPEGPRYPLTDDWPAGQFPLRKDWKAESIREDAASNAASTEGEVKNG